MTKVLLVANTDWYLYNFRRSLARFLQEQGFAVTLVSPYGKYVPRFEELKLPWLQWDVGRQSTAPWMELSALLALRNIYLREKADLLHHHTIKPVLYGSLAGRITRTRCVVNSITGRGYVYLSSDLKARLLKQLTHPFYRLSFSHPRQAAIFENDEDRRYFIQAGLLPFDRTWLIPGVGVDTDLFQPAPFPAGLPVIMLSSRMLWDKGVGTLVEAARILNQKEHVRIVLVGEPDPGNPSSISQVQLNAWAEEGLVEWWGWRNDMNLVYQQAHIVTLPTNYGEGVPTVLLEAAACGRPLVATDIPGCRSIVIDQQNGFLVPPNDPQALANSLRALIKDPALRGRMGAASRELVMKNFTVNQVNRLTLDVYQYLLSMD